MPAPLQPAHRRRAPGGRAQRRRQPGGRRIQPPHHTAQLADELSPTLRGIVERQAVGDRLHSLPEPGEREQEIVERHPQPAGPDGVAPELIREPQHGRRPGLGVEPPGEQREQLVRRAARGGERVVQVLLHQLPARRREQIVAVLKRQAERRQQPAAVLVEPEQEALHPEHAHLGAHLCLEVREDASDFLDSLVELLFREGRRLVRLSRARRVVSFIVTAGSEEKSKSPIPAG